jgi:antitoxin component YwqK of YwqJK toxin-antitoxin module
MKYLIGIMLIGLLASCGDATGDASNNTSSSNKNSSGLIQIDDNCTQLTPEQMKQPKCSEIDGLDISKTGVGPGRSNIPENYTGLTKRCDDDGLVYRITSYENGVYNGICRRWRRGRLEEHYNKNGRADGIARSWFKNGRMKGYEVKKNGIRQVRKVWDDEGKLLIDEERKNGVYRTNI